ncbi:MAG TPA: FAD binding domain-containing protein [Gaiellaceae bacterium]|nr:FAD binding domain-containing protein [Gaiellaceae bacterium]
MKPPPFAYAAPASVEEALELLADPAHEDARPLAGGQSLVPLLNMRLARPSLLVDLDGLGLDALEWANGHVRIGAMVRQRALETDAAIAGRLPLLREAAAHVAHVAIRTRGTVGGSLAHADPAAELPAAMLALDARLVVRSAAGARTVAAPDFFAGPFTTAVGAGELLEAVEVPVPPARTGVAFVEAARVHGAFALAGVAALLRLDGGGRIEHARVALCGVAGTPRAPEWVGGALCGEPPDERLFAQVGERVRDELADSADEHRRALAGVLTRRALAAAAARAGGGS